MTDKNVDISNIQELDLIEEALGVAAEQLGDITKPVMDNYYAKYPQVRATFTELSLNKAKEMEGEMVTQTIYSLMAIIQNPIVTKIMLQEAIVNHLYLKISLEDFNGLIDSTTDVIVGVLDSEFSDNISALNRVRNRLKAVVAAAYSNIQTRLVINTD
ncbi:MAG: hypothetical protein PHV02_12785 [Rhodocyclaceae bacterium]|nr:hypothetical protein [Rhodocyclaceae bacterium]